jgi:DNA replication and repair protein RecF
MLVELQVIDFRNLLSLTIEAHDRFNIFEGANGQGKTNLLEAIYLLATLRSFRESRLKMMIQWGAEQAVVRGTVRNGDVDRRLGVEITARGKRVALDGRVVTRAADYLGQLHVVVFGPEDLSLTKGAPEERRRFIDRATFGIWPAYLDEAKAYQDALRNRNKLLRDGSGRTPDRDVMEVFDMELARRGAKVMRRRLDYLEGLRPHLAQVIGDITEGALELALDYKAGEGMDPDADEATLKQWLLTRLISSYETDARRGYTTRGPHADDLSLQIGGRSIRQFASQGQHRALALSLKIAELQRLEDALGMTPMLLLDDVSSELDKTRNAQLMKYLDKGGGQVFITTTDRSWVKVSGDKQVIRVHQGQVTRDAEVSGG